MRRTDDPVAALVTGAWAYALALATLGFLVEIITGGRRA